MASRLSEESLVRIYDGGFKAVRWKHRLVNQGLLAERVDLLSILNTENAQETIQGLPPQVLFRSLAEQGVSDCLEVLPLISQEQFVAILDYDAWTDGELQHRKAFQWLQQFREADRGQIFSRFRSLEEEYQIALFGPYLRVVDPEDYDMLSSVEQDRLESFPGGALYYEIKSEDNEIRQFFADFLEVGMGEDMEYVMSVFTHAGYMPPNEQETLISQFRTARIEEDGFVPFNESLAIFQRVDISAFQKKWNDSTSATETKLPAVTHVSAVSFLDLVMDLAEKELTSEELHLIRNRHVYLANAMCSACRVEVGDSASLAKILEQIWSMNSLSLEFLAQSDPALAVKILNEEHPKHLFQVAFSLVGDIRIKALNVMKNFLPIADTILYNVDLGKFGVAQSYVDKELLEVFGFELTEILKGAMGRFPMIKEDWQDGRIILRPVDGLAALGQMKNSLEIMLAKLQLVSLTGVDQLTQLDTTLKRAIVSVHLGGHFINRYFNKEHVERWMSMSKDEFTEANEQLYNGVHLMLERDRRWSLEVNDNADDVMKAISELVTELAYIRESGRVDAIENILEINIDHEGSEYVET